MPPRLEAIRRGGPGTHLAGFKQNIGHAFTGAGHRCHLEGRPGRSGLKRTPRLAGVTTPQFHFDVSPTGTRRLSQVAGLLP